MEKKILPPSGAIALHDEYAFWEATLDFEIPTLTKIVEPRINQDKDDTTKMACTIFWPINQIIRLFGLDLTEEESNKLAKSAMEYCKREWGFTGNGRFSSLGTIFTVKRWNNEGRKQFDKPEVIYLVLNRASPRITEALSKGHLLGFTYDDNWFDDAYDDAVVNEDTHPKFGGHRTNIEKAQQRVPHYWKENDNYDATVYDNYYGYFNNYFIADVDKYLANGIDTNFYLILPKDSLGEKAEEKIEEAKQIIKEEKAVNALLWILSSTYHSLPNQQERLAELAKSIRAEFSYARELEKDANKKVMQAVVDMLSFAYKYADTENKEAFAKLAKSMREKLKLK